MQILNSILNFNLLSSFPHRLLQNSLPECETNKQTKPQLSNHRTSEWEPQMERQGLNQDACFLGPPEANPASEAHGCFQPQSSSRLSILLQWI